jgi:hypothetical protein
MITIRLRCEGSCKGNMGPPTKLEVYSDANSTGVAALGAQVLE